MTHTKWAPPWQATPDSYSRILRINSTMFIAQQTLARHSGDSESTPPIHAFPAAITPDYRPQQVAWLEQRYHVWRPIGGLIAEIVFGPKGGR